MRLAQQRRCPDQGWIVLLLVHAGEHCGDDRILGQTEFRSYCMGRGCAFRRGGPRRNVNPVVEDCSSGGPQPNWEVVESVARDRDEVARRTNKDTLPLTDPCRPVADVA